MTATISALGIWAKMAIRGETTRIETDATSLLFVSYSIFVTLFFSISRSKLPGYILPTIPILGFITTKWLAQDVYERKHWKTRGLVIISLTGTAVLTVVSIQALIWDRLPHSKPFALAGIAIAILGLASALTCARLEMQGGILRSGVFVILFFLICLNPSFLDWLDTVVSPRPIAKIVRSNQQFANDVLSYRLSRGWLYGTNFYLRRQLQEWNGDPSRHVVALVSLDGLKDLRERKIQHTVLDRTSFEEMLVEIGNVKKNVEPSEPLRSQLSRSNFGEPLADNLPRSGQPH